MPLKPLGKPPYLLPSELEQNEVVEIVEKPYVVPAERTKWGKERGKAVIKIIRNGLLRTWTMNNTTFDRLLQEFGEDPGFWLNKKVQIKKEVRNVSGVDKEVLFGRPYREPQQQLSSEHSAVKPERQSQETEFVEGFKSWIGSLHLSYDGLTDDQKQALFTEYTNK